METWGLKFIKYFICEFYFQEETDYNRWWPHSNKIYQVFNLTKLYHSDLYTGRIVGESNMQALCLNWYDTWPVNGGVVKHSNTSLCTLEIWQYHDARLSTVRSILLDLSIILILPKKSIIINFFFNQLK